MSTARHTFGMICAGLLALGGVFAAYTLTAPMTAPGNAPTPAEPTAPGATGAAPDDEANADATGEPITGRWVSERPTNPDAFVEVTPHGLWFGSDGCNSTDGTWVLDSDGSLTTSGGAMTLIGCDNDYAPIAVASAVTAHVADGRLTLTDAEGVDTTLVRDGDGAVTLPGMWVGPGSEDTATIINFLPDGTWTSTAGCQSSSGTWKLGPATDDDPSTAVPFGPGLLTIWESTSEPIPDCAGTDAALPWQFEANTEYWFGFGLTPDHSAASFYVTSADPANTEPKFTEFTRVAIAPAA